MLKGFWAEKTDVEVVAVDDVTIKYPDADKFFLPETPNNLNFLPRLKGVPQTAPAYDHLRSAVTKPRPMCLMTVNRCLCYTQQGTLMVGYPTDLCRDHVINGVFDPTKADVVNKNARRKRLNGASAQRIDDDSGSSFVGDLVNKLK